MRTFAAPAVSGPARHHPGPGFSISSGGCPTGTGSTKNAASITAAKTSSLSTIFFSAPPAARRAGVDDPVPGGVQHHAYVRDSVAERVEEDQVTVAQERRRDRGAGLPLLLRDPRDADRHLAVGVHGQARAVDAPMGETTPDVGSADVAARRALEAGPDLRLLGERGGRRLHVHRRRRWMAAAPLFRRRTRPRARPRLRPR